MRLLSRLILCLIAATEASIFAGTIAAAEPIASGAFKSLIEDAWQFALREDPLFATQTGDHRFDDQLPKVSLADESRRHASRRGFLERLEAIERNALSPSDRVNYDV